MNNTFKNSIVGGLAIFGLVSLISSSVSPSTINEVSYGTPESHVWEMYTRDGDDQFLLNKKTGEVRVYESTQNKFYLKPVEKSK